MGGEGFDHRARTLAGRVLTESQSGCLGHTGRRIAEAGHASCEDAREGDELASRVRERENTRPRGIQRGWFAEPSTSLRLLQVPEIGEPFQMGEGDGSVDADELGEIVDRPRSAITDQAEKDPPAGGVLKSRDQPLEVPRGRRLRRTN